MNARPDSWTAALDVLERDVAAVEEQLRAGPVTAGVAWTPPGDLGPLPAELLPRADAILARQFAASKAIALAIASNRKQAVAILRVEVGSQGRPRASFVDRAA